MKHHLLATLVLMALAISPAREQSTRESKAGAQTVIVFGDSITAGGALSANEREAKLRDIGDALAALAKETGCEFTSLFGTVPEASMTKDGVHPDAAGNAAIARAMLAKLAP